MGQTGTSRRLRPGQPSGPDQPPAPAAVITGLESEPHARTHGSYEWPIRLSASANDSGATWGGVPARNSRAATSPTRSMPRPVRRLPGPAARAISGLPVGASPSGKAADFGSAIRRFESSRPSQQNSACFQALGRAGRLRRDPFSCCAMLQADSRDFHGIPNDHDNSVRHETRHESMRDSARIGTLGL